MKGQDMRGTGSNKRTIKYGPIMRGNGRQPIKKGEKDSKKKGKTAKGN